MKILCFKNKYDAGMAAASKIAEVIKGKPNAVLGLATGSSPIPTYEHLVAMNKRGDVSFKNVSSINLDEYVGLAADDPQSYAYFMRKNLFDFVDISLDNTHIPNGLAEDIQKECADYESLISELGIDVQVLGIGHNGHIGFNEPSDDFSEVTHLVELTESTVNANARFFASLSDVPKSAISMGIGSILKAKKHILLANGVDKAEIIEKALFGEITPRVPASVLQRVDELYVYADHAALSEVLKKHPEAVIYV